LNFFLRNTDYRTYLIMASETKSIALKLLEEDWRAFSLQDFAPDLPSNLGFFILVALRAVEGKDPIPSGFLLPTVNILRTLMYNRELGWGTYYKDFTPSIDTLGDWVVPVLRRASYEEELFRITTSGRIPVSVDSLSCGGVLLVWDSEKDCYYGLVHPDRLADFKREFGELIKILKSW